jgi:hypothetical protein
MLYLRSFSLHDIKGYDIYQTHIKTKYSVTRLTYLSGPGRVGKAVCPLLNLEVRCSNTNYEFAQTIMST